MFRTIILICLSSVVLHSQDAKHSVFCERGYSITEYKAQRDTALTYEIYYDTKGQKSRLISYPAHKNDGIIRITDFDYRGDTIIELAKTESNDSLRRVISIKTRKNLSRKLEERTYGWINSGQYNKGIFEVVRKHKYNDDNMLSELMLFFGRWRHILLLDLSVH